MNDDRKKLEAHPFEYEYGVIELEEVSEAIEFTLDSLDTDIEDSKMFVNMFMSDAGQDYFYKPHAADYYTRSLKEAQEHLRELRVQINLKILDMKMRGLDKKDDC